MILDDRTYGIQAFDTPEEAFGLMASSWSSRSEEGMVILNDRQFVRTIGERIIRIVVETILGRVSKEKCKESLGVENAIRPLAIGRKNHLFCGNHDAAIRAAIVYSLFSCCKAHDIDVRKWLEDTLKRIPTEKHIDQLLPCNWKVLPANSR